MGERLKFHNFAPYLTHCNRLICTELRKWQIAFKLTYKKFFAILFINLAKVTNWIAFVLLGILLVFIFFQACVSKFPDVLRLASLFSLRDLTNALLAWNTKYFSILWPNKAFSSLSSNLQNSCLKKVYSSIVSSGSAFHILFEICNLFFRLPWMLLNCWWNRISCWVRWPEFNGRSQSLRL